MLLFVEIAHFLLFIVPETIFGILVLILTIYLVAKLVNKKFKAETERKRVWIIVSIVLLIYLVFYLLFGKFA